MLAQFWSKFKVRRLKEVLVVFVLEPTCVFVADAPCYYVCLEEAIYLDAVSEHRAVSGLSCNQKGQAAVVAVCISGTEEFTRDDRFLPLVTAENCFQTSNQYGDLIIYRVYLQVKSTDDTL